MFKAIRRWFINLSTKIKMFIYPDVTGEEFIISATPSYNWSFGYFEQKYHPINLTNVYWDTQHKLSADAYAISICGFTIRIEKITNERRGETDFFDNLRLEYQLKYRENGEHTVFWYINSTYYEKHPSVETLARDEEIFNSTKLIWHSCLEYLTHTHDISIGENPEIAKGIYNILKRNIGVINEGIRNLIYKNQIGDLDW